MTTAAPDIEAPRPSLWPLLAPVAALAFVVATSFSGATSQDIWYLIRGSGAIAYLLLGASMAVGLLISNRVLPAGRPRVDFYEVHIFLSLLALAFTAMHGLALLLDSYIGFSPLQLLVPFTSSYQPVAVALGVIAAYLTGAVYVSFWARRWIGYRAWRALHYASFGAFLLGTLHGLLSGTDSGAIWMLAIYAGSILTVLGLLARRILQAQAKRMVASPNGRVT